MYCNINARNLNNNKQIDIKSDVNVNGIVCTNFVDYQSKGEFEKFKGVNQIGQSINSVSLSDRDLLLEGIVVSENLTQIETFKRQLVLVFNPLDDVCLKYTDDVTEKEIIVRAISSPIFSSDIYTNNLRKFMINLNAYNPLWKDQFDTLINVETWESNFEFPFELDSNGIELARKGKNEIEIINNGEMAAPLELLFIAPALNPTIKLNGNEYIKVNKKLNEGEVLYISTAYGEKKVEITKANGEKENAYGYIDIFSTFFKLPVGINTISYETDGDYIPQKVIVKYRNQYLSL